MPSQGQEMCGNRSTKTIKLLLKSNSKTMICQNLYLVFILIVTARHAKCCRKIDRHKDTYKIYMKYLFRILKITNMVSSEPLRLCLPVIANIY